MKTALLPSLGPRGQGWVIGQMVLIGLAAVLGLPGFSRLPPTSAGEWIRLMVGLALMGGGVLIGVKGARDLGSNLTPLPRPRDDARLVESGIYRHVRHPLYLALISAAVGWAVVTMTLGASVAALALTVWLDLKSRREESWLMARFGGYRSYRQRTARFLPRLY